MLICRKFSTQRHWCCILSNRVLFFFFLHTLQTLVFWVAQVLCGTPMPLVDSQKGRLLSTAFVGNTVFISEVISLTGRCSWAFSCAFLRFSDTIFLPSSSRPPCTPILVCSFDRILVASFNLSPFWVHIWLPDCTPQLHLCSFTVSFCPFFSICALAWWCPLLCLCWVHWFFF